MPMPPEPPSAPLVGVRHFASLAEAREAALALAARGLLYEIDAVGPGWVLLVEEPRTGMALQELALFEREQTRAPQSSTEALLEPIRFGPLLWPALVMTGFFHAQGWLGRAWMAAGVADAQGIVGRGEWWRAVTALTLHADLGHFLANLVTGLIFAAFWQAQVGAGSGWLLIVASGTVGNLVNAWGYRREPHFSLGASTAVFGALGLLVAWESVERWRTPARRHKWQLIVPLGAGLSLLAYLGVGEGSDHIDFMAHGWGFACGCVLGTLYALASQGRRLGWLWQLGAGVVTLAGVAAAWWRAVG